MNRTTDRKKKAEDNIEKRNDSLIEGVRFSFVSTALNVSFSPEWIKLISGTSASNEMRINASMPGTVIHVTDHSK